MQPDNYWRLEIPDYTRPLPVPSKRPTVPATDPFAPSHQNPMNPMTATQPYPVHPLGSLPGLTPTAPPPAPYFPRTFWIVSDGKTIAADEAQVQALVDGGQVDLDIMSQEPGSAWTKPAALGFVAKPVPPVSKPAPIALVQPPAPPTDWPTPTPVPKEASTRADTSTPAQREILASAPTTPLSSPRVSKPPIKLRLPRFRRHGGAWRLVG